MQPEAFQGSSRQKPLIERQVTRLPAVIGCACSRLATVELPSHAPQTCSDLWGCTQQLADAFSHPCSRRVATLIAV